ncbi:MAG: hypothetical protein Q8P45_01080 [Candidatus Harrisonbacteria bacterium]|nr:hypothetical protein [Candidatus Harrisonbacteria bacterium]
MNRTPSPRAKTEMIEFLKDHFRYPTMNSWNRATSYARNIKIHRFGLDHETESRCFDMLDLREAFDDFSATLHEFAIRHDYAWQIGQNGRSGGYLVLYQGGKKDSGHKTRCDTCRIPTWYENKQPCHVADCGGTLEPLLGPLWQSYTQPGLGVDDDGDYESMSHEDLRRRVVLVKDFDRTCDLAVKAFVDFAKAHKVEEQEIMVPKTVRVAARV